MKDDTVRGPITVNRERVAGEIANLLHEWSEQPRQAILDRVRYYIDTIIRILPAANRFSNRQINKAHAEKLVKAIDTVERLMKSAPAGLAWNFFLQYPGERDKGTLLEIEDEIQRREARFYAGLDAIRRACMRKPGGFGTHHRFDRAARWCAEYGAELMEEVAPRARISSSSPKSTFRKVSSLLYEAVTDCKVDLDRACDQVIRERRLGQ